MIRVKDKQTLDMFELLPPPAVTAHGSLDCRRQISGLMSDTIRSCGIDRYELSTHMARLLGRDMSKGMLDAYTSESRQSHTPPLDVAIAFDVATGQFSLINFFAAQVGARVYVGADALHVELGKMERLRDQATAKIKEIKKVLGEVE